MNNSNAQRRCPHQTGYAHRHNVHLRSDPQPLSHERKQDQQGRRVLNAPALTCIEDRHLQPSANQPAKAMSPKAQTVPIRPRVAPAA